MVIMRIRSGLGNQLFQYATGYSLSKKTNQLLKLDVSYFQSQSLRGYRLDKLKIDNSELTSNLPLLININKNKYYNKILREMHIAQPLCKPQYLLETKSDIVEEFFDIEGDVYLDGYYQSQDYFAEYKKDIIRQFAPNYQQDDDFLKMQKSIDSCNSIAVHVRRGDFLKAQHDNNPNHYLLGEEYYHNAIAYISNKINNPVFFWFSDDIDWVKTNFGQSKNFVFVQMDTKNADIDELMLMKNCKHIIAANSTFSWWGSWLNENKNAIHLCPAKRYGNVKMIPETWIKIPVFYE